MVRVQREGAVDEKDPIVLKLREMLFLKQIIRCAYAREAFACGHGTAEDGETEWW